MTAAGGLRSGAGAMDYGNDMPPYVAQMAAWLDDDAAVHPCAAERAFLGAEVVFGLQRSAALGGQVALPLAGGADEQAMLNAAVPGSPALGSCPQNLREFGLG